MDQRGFKRIDPWWSENNDNVRLYYIKELLDYYIPFIDVHPEDEYQPTRIYAYRLDVVKMLEETGSAMYVERKDIPDFLIPYIHRHTSMWHKKYGRDVVVFQAIMTKRELEDLERSLPPCPWEVA